VLVAGTPCQAFSVAGLRKSLADHRGNLTLTFVELVHDADPEFVVWENVPGVLSTKDNAFGCFLAGLVGEGEPLVCRDGSWPNAGMVAGPDAPLRGGFSTLSISDWPSVGGGCSSLAAVLETGSIPARYFLSPKACRGILRRAEKRGRELPPALLVALTQAARAGTPDAGAKTTISSAA
jgi:hypothetical protein